MFEEYYQRATQIIENAREEVELALDRLFFMRTEVEEMLDADEITSGEADALYEIIETARRRICD